MIRYYIMLRRVLLYVVLIILLILIGVGVSNEVRQQWLMTYAEQTLDTCKANNLADCHIEWVYDGVVLVDVDIVGQKK